MDALDEDLPHTLTPDDIHQILAYLDLPPSPTLPSPPLEFLSEHLHALPEPLLKLFSGSTTPRQRASIREVRSRRLIYASRSPTPVELTAPMGRLRWPLLWERMGGSSLPSTTSSAAQDEEESWIKEHFPLGAQGRQHVKKLGGFMRGLQEERDYEQMARAKRVERKLDQEGEEFDEESDEEEEDGREQAISRASRLQSGVDQREVVVAFERKLLELFLDGIDTVSYDDIDFVEPPEGDPIGTRDAEDRYFDGESPSRDGSPKLNWDAAPIGNDAIKASSQPSGSVEMSQQNGQGDYDY